MKGFNGFISYQRSDTLYAVHALGYALRLAGHEAFVDTDSIGGGEREEIISRGATEVISDRTKLIETVLRLLGRGTQEPPRELRR